MKISGFAVVVIWAIFIKTGVQEGCIIIKNGRISNMSHNPMIQKLLLYIEENLDKDLSLDNLAKEFAYSKFYIARAFLEDTGITLYKYIQGRRLSEAARKLVETEQPIAWIAYEACYNSQQAFTLAFRKAYLCSPQIYRKNKVFYPKQSSLVIKQSMSGYSGWEIKGRAVA